MLLLHEKIVTFMGFDRGRVGRDPSGFSCHDTANVFFSKHSFCDNVLTLTNHLCSLLHWLTLRSRVIKDKWRLEYKAFSHKNCLKFSKR